MPCTDDDIIDLGDFDNDMLDSVSADTDKEDEDEGGGEGPSLDIAEQAFGEVEPLMTGIFSSGIMNRKEVEDDLVIMEERLGSTKREAEEVTEALLDDIEEVTDYPFEPTPDKDPNKVLALLEEIQKSLD